MYGHVLTQPLDELQPPLLQRLRLGAVGTVHKFGDRHHSQPDLGFSLASLHLFQDLPDTLTSALGSNDDT
jgi:hypothetical protein